jgi:hypothetical protein
LRCVSLEPPILGWWRRRKKSELPLAWCVLVMLVV